MRSGACWRRGSTDCAGRCGRRRRRNDADDGPDRRADRAERRRVPRAVRPRQILRLLLLPNRRLETASSGCPCRERFPRRAPAVAGADAAGTTPTTDPTVVQIEQSVDEFLEIVAELGPVQVDDDLHAEGGVVFGLDPEEVEEEGHEVRCVLKGVSNKC
jgi:hypothetical protein